MASRSVLCMCAIAVVATSCHQEYSEFKASMAQGYARVVPGASSINEAQWVHVADVAPPIDARAGKCAIPLHEDSYYGFTVGFPTGWRIDYSTGSLMVLKDERDLVGAMIFPARLRRKDYPPERLGTVVAQGLERIVHSNGGTFSLTEQKTNGATATALVHATIGGVPVSGPIEIVEKPGFATVKMYWAPDGELAADEPTLQQVTACFHRKTLITSKQPVAPNGGPVTHVGGKSKAPASTLPLHPLRNPYFNVSIPAGWTISDQSEHGMDLLSADKHASVGFGWWTPNTVAPAQSIQGSLQKYFPGAQVIKWNQEPAPRGWWIVSAEWEIAGRQHGISRMATNRQVALSTMWTADPQQWPKLQPTLEAMAASFVILPAAVAKVHADIRQQLAMYPPVRSSTVGSSGSSSSSMSDWEADQAKKDRMARDFDDGLRDQERATDSNGQHYIVPTNAYSDTGPQGAGYYVATPGGGAERLTTDTEAGQ